MPRETSPEFVAQLTAQLAALEINQAAAARLIGCSQSAISDILSGRRSPSLLLAAKIARGLGMRVRLCDYAPAK